MKPCSRLHPDDRRGPAEPGQPQSPAGSAGRRPGRSERASDETGSQDPEIATMSWQLARSHSCSRRTRPRRLTTPHLLNGYGLAQHTSGCCNGPCWLPAASTSCNFTVPSEILLLPAAGAWLTADLRAAASGTVPASLGSGTAFLPGASESGSDPIRPGRSQNSHRGFGSRPGHGGPLSGGAPGSGPRAASRR